MTTLTARPPVPAASLDLLDRACADLREACRLSSSADRYVAAHLAALRAGAALLAARSAPSRRSHPRSVWELLPRVAPDLTEWAAFYTTSARRRAAAGRGDLVPAREADDLVRQSELFLALVESHLGLPPHAPLPNELVVCS